MRVAHTFGTMEPKTLIRITLAAGLIAAVGGVGCSLAQDDEVDSNPDAVTAGGDVSEVLKSTLQLEGCTAAKVGPRHLLLAARCVSGNAAFATGKTIAFTLASSGTVMAPRLVAAPAAPTTEPATTPCTQLATCCAKIKSAGDDASVCEAAAAKKDEPACTKAHDGYATFGPCSPPVAAAPAAPAAPAANTNPNARTITISSVKIHPSYVAKCVGASCDFNKIAASDAPDIAVIILDKDLDTVPTIPVDLDPVGQADPLLAVTAGCASFDAKPTAAQKTVSTLAAPPKSVNHPGSPYLSSPQFVTRLGGAYVVTPAAGWQKGAPRLCKTDVGAPLFRAGTAAVAGVTSNYTTYAGQQLPVTTHHTRVDAQSSGNIGEWLTTLGAETTHSCSETTAGCPKHTFDGGAPQGPSTDGTTGPGDGGTDAKASDASAPDTSAPAPEPGDTTPHGETLPGEDPNADKSTSTSTGSDVDAGAGKKKKKAAGGCSAAPGTTAPSGGLLIGLAIALGAVIARRRRAS